MIPKLGLELELTLIDSYGNIVNCADEIISSDRNNGGIIGELSKSMIEVIGKPESTQKETFQNFFGNLLLLRDIAAKHDIRLVPSSTIGDDALPISNDPVRQRGLAKRAILGAHKRELEHHISGTHVHVDKHPDFEYKQFIVFQAMDPLFTLMSSTPFFFGMNTKKDYRVDIYRNKVFEHFPINGQLLDYPESISGQLELQRRALAVWKEHAKIKGIEDVGADEFNSIWGPIRLCRRTIESRAADSNLFSNVMAWTATYHAIAKFIFANNPEIIIDKEGKFDPAQYFCLVDNALILPSFHYLKRLEDIGIRLGLEDQDMVRYVTNILELAREGIEDESYIMPFADMIQRKKNFSDEIIEYSKENRLEADNRIKDDISARQIRLYVADRFDKDLSLAKEMIS